MKNTAIIIPTRLNAKRFPNKPLAKIKGIPMIVHVMNRAKEANVGEVFVATPDNEIVDIVSQNGGEAILTKNDNIFSGSDRIYEVYSKKLKNKTDFIINLQGDMPNINPKCINKLAQFMKSKGQDIGTLCSLIDNRKDITNPNIVKVQLEKDLKNEDFFPAKDFFRIKKDLNNEKVYHHIGIYAFTSVALTKYVRLARSKLEIERNLEQMRAMENNMVINVGLCDSSPLGVDTESDLEKIIKEMN